jgi:flagellar assembly factor FliW
MTSIQLDTRFGKINVDPAQIITFSKGIPGFEKLTKWMLFHEVDEHGKWISNVVVHLQSIEDPDISLSLTDPGLFGFNYELVLSDSDVAELKLEDPSDAVVLATLSNKNVTLPNAKTQSGADVFVNISAPILINSKSRIGIQKVLDLNTANSSVVIKA